MQRVPFHSAKNLETAVVRCFMEEDRGPSIYDPARTTQLGTFAKYFERENVDETANLMALKRYMAPSAPVDK